MLSNVSNFMIKGKTKQNSDLKEQLSNNTFRCMLKHRIQKILIFFNLCKISSKNSYKTQIKKKENSNSLMEEITSVNLTFAEEKYSVYFSVAQCQHTK